MFRFMSHHRPALGSGFVECLVQFPDMRCAIVGAFTLSVGMMNQAHESRPGSRSRPLQHLVIAVGIAEGKNGTTAMNCWIPIGLPSLSHLLLPFLLRS